MVEQTLSTPRGALAFQEDRVGQAAWVRQITSITRGMPKTKRMATISMIGRVVGSAFTTASMVANSRIAAVATANGTAGRA